ncbi:MAG: pilus assembly protein [Peptococcaceae bacterium]|nr:pilus assembly protein [Peptococcaceae bacterium]
MHRLLKDGKGSITLEFAICGIMFVGFVMGMVVMGLWIYNNSQVKQAARIAALRVAVTNDPAEARQAALQYLNKTLVSCPIKMTDAFGSQENGYGVAEAEMNPLFPGFQRLIDPRGTSSVEGRIRIRKEAMTVREYRFRPDSD